MARDIVKTIKINAQTKNAIKNINDVKKATNQLPAAASNAAQKVKGDFSNMETAAGGLKNSIGGVIASFTAMYVGFTQIRNAFAGIIQDAESVRRLDAAIQSMGVSTQISLQSVLSFADGLQNQMGQSAAETANIMTRLVDAGVKTQ